MVYLSSQVCSQHTIATEVQATLLWYRWRFLTDAMALGYRLRRIHHGVFAVIVGVNKCLMAPSKNLYWVNLSINTASVHMAAACGEMSGSPSETD